MFVASRQRGTWILWSPGSNKGHDVCYLQYLSVPVGCHLGRKVVGFAASHEAVNRRVLRLESPGCPSTTSQYDAVQIVADNFEADGCSAQ